MANLERELADLVQGMQRERRQIEPFYRAAAQLVTPLYNHWGSDGQTHGMLKRLECVFTNSGIRGAERFASFLLGMATPPGEPWFQLGDVDDEVNDDYASRVWYADATEDVRRQLHASFYKAMRPANLEMSVSYGCIFSFEHQDKAGRDTGNTVFRHKPSHTVWYTLDVFGNVDAVASQWQMTKTEAEGFFDPSKIKDEDGLKEAGDRALFWHIVRRESDDDKLVKKTEDMPFQSYWMNPGMKRVIDRSGYNEMPYHIFRWEEVPGSTYSVGPAYAILPELRGANVSREHLLRALAWAGNPPVLMPKRESGMGRPTIAPGKRIYGGVNKDGKRLYDTLDGMANPAPLVEATVDAESRIRDAFFTNEMNNHVQKEMTATESAFRQQERAHMMGPFAVALYDPLKSVVERVFKMRIRSQKIVNPPEVLMERGDYSTNMIGPLQQAVQQSNIGTTLQAIQQIMLLGDFDPQVRDVVDGMGTARMILDKSGVHPDVERSEQAVALLQEQRQQAQQAQMQMEQQAQQASAMRDAGAAVRDVSNATA